METNTNKHQTQTARKTTRRPRIWSTVGVHMCVLVFACLWWPPKCGPFLHVFCAFPIYKFILPQERWNKASLAMIFVRDNLRNTNGNEATKKQKETRRISKIRSVAWSSQMRKGLNTSFEHCRSFLLRRFFLLVVNCYLKQPHIVSDIFAHILFHMLTRIVCSKSQMYFLFIVNWYIICAYGM
jgi:hypothetical protein